MKINHVLFLLAFVSLAFPLAFKVIAQEHPSSPVAAEAVAKHLVDRGNEKAERGDLVGAIADYKLALKAKPDYARAYYDLGVESCQLGNLEAEVNYFTQAIKYDPKDADSFTQRGLARIDLYFSDTGKYKLTGVIADFNQAIKLDPRQANAFLGRGRLQRFQGNTEEAFSDFNRSIQLNPNSADAYMNRGNSYSELAALHQEAKANYWEKAISDFSQAIKLKPDFATAFNNRGQTYDQLGNKKAAIADLQMAAQIYAQKKMMGRYRVEIEQLELVKK